jgi:hypothetical protein
MVDVFISYSRTDLAAVTRLARAVEAEGYAVWWDADLPPHLSYGDVITNKIGAAKAAIVVWSKESVSSEWVRAEADMARNQKKLVQTALDNVMPPLPFNQIQFAEIGNWRGESEHPGWRKVKTSLAALCGPRDGSENTQEAYHLPLGQAANPLRRHWLPYAGVGVIAALLVGAFMLGNHSASAPLASVTPAIVERPVALAEPGQATTGPAVKLVDENDTLQGAMPERGSSADLPQVVQTTVRRMVKRDANNQVVEIVTETKSVYSVYADRRNSNRLGSGAPQLLAASATVAPVPLKQTGECISSSQTCADGGPKATVRPVLAKPIAQNPT